MEYNDGMKPQVISIQEAADLLRVRYQTVYRMIRDGELHGFRVGRLWRVSTAELERFISADNGEQVETNGQALA